MSKRLIYLLLLIVAIAGCSASIQSPLSTKMPLPNETLTPYQTPTVPVPGQDTGVVIGRFFSTKMNAPLSSIGAYLGDYVYLTPGPHHMVTIRQQGSPHAVTDVDGRFVIDKVPPGKYPLLAWTPFSSTVIPDKSGSNELVVEVLADQVTDVGEIRIDFP